MSVQELITVSDAISILDMAPLAPRVVRVKLDDAQGMRLAQDIRADRDYPPFDKSLMDGYAVRSGDVRTTPVELDVVGEIAAGDRSIAALQAGQAIAIMTGAPIPDGADGVVPVEDSEITSTGVRIVRADGPQRFIAKRGADCAVGTIVLPRGTKLEAAQLAVAGSFGVFEVDAYAKPRAAVLSTGNEIVGIDQIPGPAQIRNSNNVMLMALLKRLGCDVADLGIARDDPETIRRAIENGLSFDALFISGGMSMGHYDFVPRILIELGVQLKITKLKMKPGKPFVFGQLGNTSIFGLPGNPVSSFVCALRLCSRIIARLSGANSLERWASAQVESPLEKNGDREFYQPAIFDHGRVKPLKWKGSADIYTLAAANGLIVRSENSQPLPAGAIVDVLEIPS